MFFGVLDESLRFSMLFEVSSSESMDCVDEDLGKSGSFMIPEFSRMAFATLAPELAVLTPDIIDAFRPRPLEVVLST